MSARGVKGASVAVGGTDGSDFHHRQVLAPRYEAMAVYRAQLVSLFTYMPYLYLAAILITAVHCHAPQLKPITATFMPPFWVQVGLLLIGGVATLNSVRLQSSLGAMIAAAFFALPIACNAVLYTWQVIAPDASKKEQIGTVWYLLGAIVNAAILALSALAIYNGYMITLLQGSKQTNKKR